MQRALACAAAAAVFGLAGAASAATTTILDEGYSGFNGYGPEGGGSWAAVTKDTSTAYSGSASMKIDNHSTVEPFIHSRAALDVPVAVDGMDPNSATLSFMYKLKFDEGPADKSFKFYMLDMDWSYTPDNGGPELVSGPAQLTGDDAWHSASVSFSGWVDSPTPGGNLTWLAVLNNDNDWSRAKLTLNLDNFVFTSPVPEPTVVGLLATGALFALRRRRA